MIPEAVIAIGSFLVEHADVIKEIEQAIAGGSPKDAIIAALRGVQADTSRAALQEELDAAAKRSGAV